ncbi:DUF4383 domain-containing protein [Amycolatopsis sp. OK19-0408]|uniref:DUF4383 domain-containing protein n=1 Tax=Amycolatopsis iheyensis TaxID=2945988 RepID=A0A9X2N873_9PSEU|nr:DUF4383 domain-containing protein [Amycolatopsis iheyensis]MCR6483779.1 DUF4383 domain-containing protein [Amycolatopsis iheyensis]
MTSSTEARPRAGPGWLRPVVAVVGLLYLALGVAGFLTPETASVGHRPENTVWLFSVTTVLTMVHTLVGVLGLLAATKRTGSVIYCWVLFLGFAGMTAYGVFAAAFAAPEDPINVNWADNWLHGLTAVAGLVFGIAGARAATRRAQEVPTHRDLPPKGGTA